MEKSQGGRGRIEVYVPLKGILLKKFLQGSSHLSAVLQTDAFSLPDKDRSDDGS